MGLNGFILKKYETIETYARAFLTLNILAIGRVATKQDFTVLVF